MGREREQVSNIFLDRPFIGGPEEYTLGKVLGRLPQPEVTTLRSRRVVEILVKVKVLLSFVCRLRVFSGSLGRTTTFRPVSVPRF